MKRSIIAIILLLVAFSGCRKESMTSTTGSTDAIVGTWRVSSFIKDNNDISGQFNGYVFTCYANGHMTITGNNFNYNNCSWNWDSMNHNMCGFHLMGCDSNSILWELDEDWEITTHDATHCNFISHNPHHNCTMSWVKN